MERTLVMLKPDGVKRGLLPQVTERLQAKGYRLANIKLLTMTDIMVRAHVQHLQHKPYYEELVAFLKSGPVIPMIWTGPNVVKGVRQVMGYAKPLLSPTGTIRGDFAHQSTQNVAHASDSIAHAETEIQRFFGIA
jgi:nucleoside-diphosphate kinase